MSHVTSVVVVMPGIYVEEFGPEDEDTQRAFRLGHLMMQSQSSQKLSPHAGYRFVPGEATDGTKVPTGFVWWLGLNGAQMDRMIEEISRHEEFYGVTVWFMSYDDPVPTPTVIVISDATRRPTAEEEQEPMDETSPFSPMTRAEFIKILTTGGAGTRAEAEALLDAYLTEFVGELSDDAQKWARGAAVKKVGGMFPGQTGINFAHEVADDIVAAVFSRDPEERSSAKISVGPSESAMPQLGQVYRQDERPVSARVTGIAANYVTFDVGDAWGWRSGAGMVLEVFRKVYPDGPYKEVDSGSPDR